MVLMFAGVLSDVTSQNAGGSDVTDTVTADTVTADSVTADSVYADSVTATDNVVETSAPPVVRRMRRSMALAIDTDVQRDSDDVSRLCNCFMSSLSFCLFSRSCLLPLLPSITPFLLSFWLKTYLFHLSFPPQPGYFTHWTNCMLLELHAFRLLFRFFRSMFLKFYLFTNFISMLCRRKNWLLISFDCTIKLAHCVVLYVTCSHSFTIF